VADALGLSHDDEAFVYWMIDKIGIGSIPGSSFYRSDPGLGQGRIRFAFPKKDETLDKVEERFAKLKTLMNV
jgi:L-glutamine---4-(methylsulfanyl)-2-oxobutanoate aminotransferase